MTKRNFSQACLEVRDLGMTLRRTGYDDELRVAFRGEGDRGAYFTSDLDDAVDTASAMFKARHPGGLDDAEEPRVQKGVL